MLKFMERKEIDLGCGKMWLGEDHIIRVVYNEGLEVALEEARQTSLALRELSQGVAMPVLVDARRVKSISREARSYFATREVTQMVGAVAALSSPMIRMLATLYVNLNRPPFEIRYFTSEAEGLRWLKEVHNAAFSR